jgi:putative ATP-dependent endonuclease of OLD family
LVVDGPISETQRDELLASYTSEEEKKQNHNAIQELYQDSNTYMSEKELTLLQDSAKRVRGEIFFARKWLIVEGQSDHIFMTAAAELLDYPFDVHGVSVIDSQNCGSPGSFSALARAFGYPWAALFDGDGGGDDCAKNIEKQGFAKKYLANSVMQFPKKTDLEAALVASLPQSTVDAILVELNKYDGVSALSDKRRIELFRKNKIVVASKVSEHIRAGRIKRDDMPAIVIKAIEYIKSSDQYR